MMFFSADAEIKTNFNLDTSVTIRFITVVAI